MTGNRKIPFAIDVYPSQKDPNNWCWRVRWTRPGEAHSCTASGPGPEENVLSTALAAKQSAEKYAKTMGRNLMESRSYTFTVEGSTDA